MNVPWINQLIETPAMIHSREAAKERKIEKEGAALASLKIRPN